MRVSCRQSPGEALSSPTDSARELLLQKRVSLTHTPDIIRVFDRDINTSRQQEQHEFQKVRNSLLLERSRSMVSSITDKFLQSFPDIFSSDDLNL